ncbi:hypothetical protein [Marinobacter salsuginis]|uniref:hypothetical protein n=1 Tax=Marinobacter salsuginis TaxID=418719 RepID=UPI001D0DBD0E|nr:hypothetical protein [Marinobacter salsuginis]
MLTPEQFAHLLGVIQKHRYPKKNTAPAHISFKLRLRVQEIPLLQIKDVAELGPVSTGSGQRSFKLTEILALPSAYTKCADALKWTKSTYQPRRIGFNVHDFHHVVQRIETMAKASSEIKPEDFYPEVKKHRGKSRDLPMKEASISPILSRSTLPPCRGIGQALREPAPIVGGGL